MKLSTKLLLAVLTLAVFALVGTNLVLRAEYDRMDFKNPFWNYVRIPMNDFRHLSLTSSSSRPVEIRTGTEARPVLYVLKEWKDSLRVDSNRDTLQIRFRADDWNNFQQPVREFEAPDVKAELILFLPDLRTLTVRQQTWLQLQGVRLDSLQLTQTGYSACTFRDSQIGTLGLTLRDSSFAALEGTSQVRTLNLDAAGRTGLKFKGSAVRQFRPEIRDERVEIRTLGKSPTRLVNPD